MGLREVKGKPLIRTPYKTREPHIFSCQLGGLKVSFARKPMSFSMVPSPNLDSARGLSEAIPLTLSSPQTVTGRKTIIVVDDSLVVRKVLAMKLKANGYDVLEAADGAAALSLVRSSRPDLMLLDISFPADVAQGGGASWDGFHIMEWVRRMDEAKNMPVIIITGGNADEYRPRS